MTPPTPDIAVSEERVKELRESVRTGRVIISGDAKDLSTLINIVEGYSSLRAENERLKENVQRCEENYAEALHLASTYQETAEKAEAQLAKQAPLIEAIGGPGEGEIEWGQYSTTKAAEAILRAALALREEKK